MSQTPAEIALGSGGRKWVKAFLARFDALGAALVKAGFPRTSPWFRAEIGRFFQSGRRRWVLRVGRRGGKSSTLCRLAVCWALWGAWSVPPGDVAVVGFVSIDREEASARIRTIREILDVLGAKYEERGDEIEVPSERLVFRVVTCSISKVGFTAVALFYDEMARWESRETAANPAREVVTSMRPTMATQPDAFEVCSSSPWGDEDLHYELFEAGDNEHQITSCASTWTANPTISEQRTHELEPDPVAWSREYAAIPGGTTVDRWFADAVERAKDDAPMLPLPPGVRPLFSLDPAFESATSPDLFGWACITSEPAATLGATGQPRRITRVRDAGEWLPDRGPYEMARRVRTEVCDRIDPSRADEERVHCFSDQHEGRSFTDLCALAGIRLEVVPWKGGDSDDSQYARFKSVRTAMLAGDLKIPAGNTELIRQFKSVQLVLLPSGKFRIKLPRSSAGHCDMLSATVLGASLALERLPTPADPPPLTPNEYVHEQQAEMRRDEIRRSEERKRKQLASASGRRELFRKIFSH